jgi:hypothetical protein
MSSTKLADGSGAPDTRIESAFVHAIDSCLGVGRSADKLLEELDAVTRPSGVVRGPLNEDDSLVIAVREAREVASKAIGRT